MLPVAQLMLAPWDRWDGVNSPISDRSDGEDRATPVNWANFFILPTDGMLCRRARGRPPADPPSLPNFPNFDDDDAAGSSRETPRPEDGGELAAPAPNDDTGGERDAIVGIE